MDVDAMTTQERSELMRKGLCFGCKKPGHLSRNCPDKMRKTPSPQTPTKMKGKELHAHVRALMAQMEEGDVEEFFAESAQEGF